MTSVLVAFDKFKGAVGAQRACEVAANTIRRARPTWRVDVAPLTDGGEGFCEALVTSCQGSLLRRRVRGPLGTPVEATLGVVSTNSVEPAALELLGLAAAPPTRVLVVELAAASGLSLVPTGARDPWRTSTHGTGELLAAARDLDCQLVLLGVGGSATSDLGLGALQALGYRYLTAEGSAVEHVTPAEWASILRILPPPRLPVPPLVVACDVDSPLLGPDGAAAVYGPQKGLAASDLPRHERLAARLARLLCEATGSDPCLIHQPGAGAAGGTAFGLMAGAGARLVGGFELVARWLELARRAASADFVITGEGRFDASSLLGKGPGALLRLCHQVGTPALAFVGSIATDLDASGVPVQAISPAGLPLEQAMAMTEACLERSIAAWLQSSTQPSPRGDAGARFTRGW